MIHVPTPDDVALHILTNISLFHSDTTTFLHEPTKDFASGNDRAVTLTIQFIRKHYPIAFMRWQQGE